MSSILTLAGNNTSDASFYPHTIDQSLRFEDGDSAHLSRTPSSAGNRKTWTWSAWVKRGNIDSNDQTLWRAYGASGATGDYILPATNGDNTIYLGSYNSSASTKHVWRLITSAVFRDVSSWYHIVASVDTTQSTASNRAKLYINGQQVTEFSTETYPSLNYDTYTNTASEHHIGIRPDASHNFDGYMAEVNFIDGLQLGPDSFGEFKDGIWIAKDVSGLTYGTNGFHLDFADSSAIGNDVSGNDNDFAVSGLVATDVVLDSMTNNFAVLNVLTKGTSNTSLAEGNLKANAVSSGSGSNWGTVFSSFTLPSTGKYYVEGLAFINNGAGNSSHLGVLDTSSFKPAHNNSTYAYTTGEGFDGIYVTLFNNNAQPVSDGVLGTAEGSLTGTTVVAMLAVDIDNGKVWAGYDGTWLNSGNPAAGSGEVATRTFSSSDAVSVGIGYNGTNDQGMFANFGQDSSFAGLKSSGSAGASDANGQGDFFYAPPSGAAGNFLALCSANLPEPSIIDASQHFNTVLYTGTSAENAITGVGFQPDFSWFKDRGNSTNHVAFDSVRGATKTLRPDDVAAETTDAQKLKSFDSDGFTLGTDNNPNGSSRGPFVAWNWLAGTSVSGNTTGSGTAKAYSGSVNTEAGFSIIKYVGNGTAGHTIPHNLSAKPSMAIFKNRDVGDQWAVYHKDILATHNLCLNDNTAKADQDNRFNDTEPTDSVMTLGAGHVVNATDEDYIAYFFTDIDQYCKAGVYSGNGSSDGTYVFLGFRPAWVMVKSYDNARNWTMYDNKRTPYNLMNGHLHASSTVAEQFNEEELDFLSNGFKFRTNNADSNYSGFNYIYLAFGSSPAKYSNAK